MNYKTEIKQLEQTLMAQVKFEEKFKENKKAWQVKLKEALLNQYFELEFEKRYQERGLILDIKKIITLNGQKVPATDYVNMLKNDLENLKNRISLLEDMEGEIK